MLAVVVPTIRPEKLAEFKEAWKQQFIDHNVQLYVVHDGVTPRLETPSGVFYEINEVMGKHAHLIYSQNDGVRNLGFAKAYQDGADIIVSLDDDVLPLGDTLGDHIRALDGFYETKWVNTSNEVYMRGFPYNERKASECVLSHGVWQGVADYDASTQLVLGIEPLTYRRMPLPHGTLFPMCIMNVAFKRKMTPYMYQAPMFDDINRFADIWAGIEAKKDIDLNGWCAVTGYAQVQHNRASNPFINLVKEARGVGMNEKYGEGAYFELFKQKRAEWINFLRQ